MAMRKGVAVSLMILVVGVSGVAALWLMTPAWREQFRRDVSDAGDTETLRVAGDNYLGYWFLTSPEMRRLAPRRGFTVDWTDDGGDYAGRLRAFAGGEYDAIVLPVNSYVEHGAPNGYPGLIVASISESRGADAIVGFADTFPTGTVAELNDPAITVVYTGASPSAFLLDMTIANFDLFHLRSHRDWRREVGSSAEVYEAATRNEGDAFVLWEPDVSRALALPGMRYLWGSDRFRHAIVDVVVVRDELVARNPGLVRTFLDTYFRVLATYAASPGRMADEMRSSTGLDQAAVAAMLDNIEWFDLHENAQLQFGLDPRGQDPFGGGASGTEGLINTIIAATDVLVRTGTVASDPLEGDYYRITNSSFVEGLSAGAVAAVGRVGEAPVAFAPLDDAGWEALRAAATLRFEHINFQPGRNLLDRNGKETVDKIAGLLINQYPAFRVEVHGHTGAGNPDANLALSRARAEAVVQYLTVTHEIDPDRLRAVGWGATRPPARKPGENARSFRDRHARVEFVLYDVNPF